MTDGIIGTALNVFGEKEYPNRSRELRAMATLLEKALPLLMKTPAAQKAEKPWPRSRLKFLKKSGTILPKNLKNGKKNIENFANNPKENDGE